ncbi:MAG TPA: beta-propeller fold lactonase family protein, partial [Amycolatopsis sp.]|nr:beta-propeller fold lactonase family protein [Amycolatopsis sp.]
MQWVGLIGAFALATVHVGRGGRAVESQALGATTFTRLVLTPPGEAPLEARLFTGPVKLDSQNEMITGANADPVKKIVGAAPAGERAGLQRFTKILFEVDYFTGRPNPGDRVDPNNVRGDKFWPFRELPMRSWPYQVAVTPDGRKVYVTLPGREGYPDFRVAVVDTGARVVTRWIDLRPAGNRLGTRPTGIAIANNPAIFPRPFAVVQNMYGNFASVIDTGTDQVIGEFSTDFYGEKVVFNATGTRLYTTDRFKDEVRAFRVDPGPAFTQIAEIPAGATHFEDNNPRDLALSADGQTLYVATTLGHTIAVINVANDANTLVRNLPVGGLPTDVKIAGRWGIVAGHGTGNVLNQPETGHGMPTKRNGVFIKNTGEPLGYLPVMGDNTRATTFDDLGSELNVFDTATNLFVFRYVDAGRNLSLVTVPGQVVDLGDFTAAQLVIRGSGPEQITVRGDLLFVSQFHSDEVEVFRINQDPATPAQILTRLASQFTGGITPQGLVASPDGKTLFVANMQTEDLSFLAVNPDGTLTRTAVLPVGVTSSTPDPVKGGNGDHLFARDEEVGLRWLFSSAYSDDGQKSCGFCHWQSRSDGSQWNVGANAIGGPKVCPQNKDISDNWPEWFEGLSSDMNSYTSSCQGEVVVAERPTAVFPQPLLGDRLRARDAFVKQKTAEASRNTGRTDLDGNAFSVGYYDMGFLQILFSQNETRRMPNPTAQFPTAAQAARINRGKLLFSTKVAQGGSGCVDCHHNGEVLTNGVVNDTFQDYNIYEPGVVSDHTVDGNGIFFRRANDYFFEPFAPPQDLGSRQNITSRNTKHLRAFWDSSARWLHHGDAHSVREILLVPDSPFLRPGERGFNFITQRRDHSRSVGVNPDGTPGPVNPTDVPITFADSRGGFGGDARGPIFVSLDSPFVTQPDGTLLIDRLGSDNLAPLVVVNAAGQKVINPQLAASGIA